MFIILSKNIFLNILSVFKVGIKFVIVGSDSKASIKNSTNQSDGYNLRSSTKKTNQLSLKIIQNYSKHLSKNTPKKLLPCYLSGRREI